MEMMLKDIKENEEKSVIKGKRIECILGLFFLIPPILGCIAFVFNLFDNDSDFARLKNLSYNWTCGDNAMSAAPIYLGLMAIVGAYLIKDNIKYLFPEK